jgi:nucleoside-diphosphate-sugar epimerase
MRALITGAEGFVGRHMVEELDERGWSTIGIDIHTHGPLSDANYFFRRIDARYDLVVHAAASAPHRNAIDNEHGHFARNVQLDAAMFEWATRTKQSHVLYLSSSAVYPITMQTNPVMDGPLTEDYVDPTFAEEPDSEYGWAKLTGERMAAAARRAGLHVTVVRPFSGYGEDQSPNFPFQAILDRVRARKDPLEIWGDGSQVRDWIHISDVVKGALAVVEADTDEPVNLCTGVGTSMRELALIAAHEVGYDPAIKPLVDKPAGVAYRVGDPTRFHAYYEPKITIEEGVRKALR